MLRLDRSCYGHRSRRESVDCKPRIEHSLKDIEGGAADQGEHTDDQKTAHDGGEVPALESLEEEQE